MDLYCLSFQKPIRKSQMEERFKQLEMNCLFYEGVGMDDPRIVNNNGGNCWGCMLGHMDMIKHFYENSEKEYGIFCEDDVYIHKDFCKVVPDIITDFELMNLDVLLLGYLSAFQIKSTCIGFDLKTKHSTYTYHNYPDNLWGSQMYMLSKKHAKYLVDKYTVDYASQATQPFSSDWTITKEGNRALIYPMLAVETADKKSGHLGQDMYHDTCKKCNYNPDIFI